MAMKHTRIDLSEAERLGRLDRLRLACVLWKQRRDRPDSSALRHVLERRPAAESR